MTRYSEEGPDELRRLQACLNDLIGVMALPALWSDRGSSQVIAALLEALVRMLRLEFAYARLAEAFDGAPAEAIRPWDSAHGDLRLRAASEAWREWQAEPGEGARRVPNPAGAGDVWMVILPLGNRDSVGALVAAAARPEFPSVEEMLVLKVAASQAAIGLEEARRRGDQDGAARTLEQRVAERTLALSEVNAQLRRQIAERKRAEDERLMLATLVENSTDFIGLASLRGQVLFVNPAGQAITGVQDDEELRSVRVFDFLVEQDRPRVQNHIWPAVLEEGRWDGELRFRNLRTGVSFPMHTHVFLVKDPSTGYPVATATVSRDITQRKRAEAELVALKDQLAGELTAMTRLHELSTRLQAMSEVPQILDTVLLAIMSLQEADGGVVHLCNAETKALEIVAYRGVSAEWVARAQAAGDPSSAYARALAQRGRVVVEDVHSASASPADRVLGDSAGYRAVQSTPLLNDGGPGLGTISTHFRRPHRPTVHQLRFTDLYARQASERIARHRMETALKRSEAYLAEGQKISHTGSWAWHRRTGELFWSLEHYRIYGVDPARGPVSHEDFLRMVHPEDRGFVRAMLDDAVDHGGEFDCEYRLVRPDGSVRYLHSRGHRLEDGDGDTFVGSVVDETERKRAEAALVRAREELAHVARVTTMGELTASIAHEVNQPLAAVVTNANACLHWLAAQPANMEEAHSAAQRIIRDANRASEVITRIRTFLTRGKPHYAALRIEDVIREVVGMVRGEARAKGVAVVVMPDAQVPRVLGDRVQLQQVVLNLVMNAIEAMSPVKGRARILEIGAFPEGGGEVKVVVRDTGPGLDAMQREKVFDAFYTTKPHGMGMGLAISRSIVETHGGRLWATRNSDAGETFQFTLPVEEGVAA
jgi:PAS domain S-box-containing protein